MLENDMVDGGLAGAPASFEQERFVDEPPKDTRTLPVDAERNQYQRDRARVLHSAAFRRLAAKTQVHTAGTAAFRGPRRPPSLGVAQPPGEMGAGRGCAPEVVHPAGRAHDRAPPP